MKIALTFIFSFSLQFCYSQSKTVRLSLNSFKSANKKVDSATAVDALKIATIILNSQEFSDSLNRYNFTCENYGVKCNNERIKGSVVLDSLLRAKNVALDLTMRNCSHEYGHSEKDKYFIKSCYRKLRKDDNTLPFSHIYAYHICHEYMHIVGFFHTDYIDDVAEKVGWIAYYILDRWYKENRKLI